MERESLGRELQKLSVEGASMFHGFMNIASDMAKTVNQEKKQLGRETTIDSIESDDDDDFVPGVETANPTSLKKPQISCAQS